MSPSRRIRVVVLATLVLSLGAGLLWAFRSHVAGWPIIGRLAPAPAEALWTCTMHPHIREHGPGTCPICGMALVPVSDGGQATPAETMPASVDPDVPRVAIAIDARRRQLIGVRTVTAERTPLSRSISATGIVRYDETRIADVNVKLDGWIEELFIDATGQWVDRGAPLFSLYSPDLVSTQQEYVQAIRSRDSLVGSTMPDTRAYADRLVEAARRRLELWDLPADQIARLTDGQPPATHLVFRSPAAGFVVEKSVVRGQRVMAGQSLYRLADLSVVWVEADLYEQDVAFVREGDRAVVTLDAYPGEPVAARVVYLYPYADATARTVRARFSIDNRSQRFRPGLYARVELTSRLGEGLTVPSDAVLDSGAEQVVFVAEGDGYFSPRRVTTGRRFDDRVEIRDGLTAGDLVASGAAFFLDSESQLRAAVQGFDPAPVESGQTAAMPALDVVLATRPDPPRAGDNTFEVTVRDVTGAPVTGAAVTVSLFMPAMPSMNMPAMRADAALLEVGGGLYRGQADVGMAGRWDVTITVMRGGQVVGRVSRALVAR